MKKDIKEKPSYILCTTLGIILFMLTSCNYLAVDEYFNDLTPLDSIFARQDYLEQCVGNCGINARSRQLVFRFLRSYETGGR